MQEISQSATKKNRKNGCYNTFPFFTRNSISNGEKTEKTEKIESNEEPSNYNSTISNGEKIEKTESNGEVMKIAMGATP